LCNIKDCIPIGEVIHLHHRTLVQQNTTNERGNTMSNKLLKHAIEKIASKYGIEIETRYDLGSDCAERFYYFNGIYTGITTECPLEQVYMELYWCSKQYTR